MRILVVVWGCLTIYIFFAGILYNKLLFGGAIKVNLILFVLGLAAFGAPFVMEIALVLTAPYERRVARSFVAEASIKLKKVSPYVIAVTGSYGKTSAKNYIAHLLKEKYFVLATPASFNNNAGLARSINEQLMPSTQVFVAEMGIYGPGEISAMCTWTEPKISVITAIGPVHLERMKTMERIVSAKAEILDGASVGVLNIDNPYLSKLANELEAALAGREPEEFSGGILGSGNSKKFNIPKKIVRCSTRDISVDVCVLRVGSEEIEHSPEIVESLKIQTLDLYERGSLVAKSSCPSNIHLSNIACAIAVGLEMDIPWEKIATLLPLIPEVPNRLVISQNQKGVTVIDDTYNSNPTGAKSALDLLGKLANSAARETSEVSRCVLVTPGMVELGKRQKQENFQFAKLAGEIVTDLVVVGRSNKKALIDGIRATRMDGTQPDGPQVITAKTLPKALDWVRRNLIQGDVVLYENDLPDHFP
jgi:UDP-N-acetylmuramoyl-tripeptide--D-alanyl-D-alanine ligase